MKTRLTAVLPLAILIGGCTGIGPQTIERDNYSYGESLGNAAQQQMLINIVKLRYADTPVFLEIASVINQYTLEGQVGVNAPGWDRPSQVGPPIASAGSRWSDRPTITYAPLSGERFMRSLMTPLPPAALAALLQSGWPAEFVFGTTVRSINGVANGTRAALLREEPDPRFPEILEILTDIQRSSNLGIRIERHPDRDAVVLVFERSDAEGQDKLRERLGELLGLDPQARSFTLAYGMVPSKGNEIAILSRSMLEIIAEFSFGIDIPQEHIDEGRAMASPDFTGPWVPPKIQIHATQERPEDALVEVRYRDLWFWIDDRDFLSKRAFTFMLILVSLAESGQSPAMPMLTVGTGG